ncbi:MAG TPA: hypothetical protein VG407_00300 [Caulobacteraceae bacterium]|jgi:hypothetical protein|nr:hypothetical protein [Caulobacteraceae bacterium]
MTEPTDSNDAIAERWIAYYLRNGAGEKAALDSDPDWWALETMMALQFDDPLRALEIVFLIAHASGDAWVLTNLGAGPLEGLLADDPTFLDAIVLETTSCPNLKTALVSVWQNGMPDETYAAVRRLSGSGE